MVSSPFSRLPGAVGDPPEHYGSPIGEQRALERGEAVVDLSDRDVVAVSGEDRLTWLDALTSQALATLAPGTSTETLLLDPSGRIEHAARVVDDGTTTWLLLDAGAGASMAAFLERMRFRSAVEVADRSAEFATVGTLGDPPLLEPAGSDVPRPVTWVDPWRAVTAGGWQYATAAEHPGASWTWSETLVPRDRLGELTALPHAGTLAAEALRIAVWRPREATELDAATLPHELDWLRSAVHLAKGCYRGQETVAKVHNLGHPPRRLVLLHLDGSEGAVVRGGDEVLAGAAGAEPVGVGRVTAAAVHHELGPIALALVRRSADRVADLVVVTDDGTRVAAAQEIIVPPDAGATAGVPRMPRLARR
ncbi:MAG: folate-binding protein YgfZ [Micrococcales bacterium]|nr:folate-binding protein YgfZ [Micrococcales bacterium]